MLATLERPTRDMITASNCAAGLCVVDDATLKAETLEASFASTKERLAKEWGLYLTGEAELCQAPPCDGDPDSCRG